MQIKRNTVHHSTRTKYIYTINLKEKQYNGAENVLKRSSGVDY